MTRIAWYLGNWIAQLVFAFRIGYRDGSALRPGTRPNHFRCTCYTRTKEHALLCPQRSAVPTSREPVMPFVHWSKDPLVPYPGCACASCSSLNRTPNLND